MIRELFGLALLLSCASSTYSASALLPYATLNAGEDYVSTSHSLANVAGYLPGESYTISGNEQLVPYFMIKDGQLILQKNLTLDDFSTFSKSCTVLDENPNKLLCNLTVTSDGGQNAVFPLILYKGLRAKDIDEVISERVKDNVIHTSKPYYFEISATPGDFTQSKIPVVDLRHYFAASAEQKIKFVLDATHIAGPKSSCPVKLISGVNQVTCASPDNFDIDTTAGVLMAGHLQEGVYQINVRAESTGGTTLEKAWQTFYINVNENNPSLSAWKGGAVASTNVLGAYTSIYVYSTKDPAKGGDWTSDYQSYAKDLSTINSTYLTKQPIKTVLVEIISMIYPNDGKTWALKPNANPENQVTENGILNDRSNIGTWIKELTEPFRLNNIGITLNYTFSNQVKADFLSFNNKQQDIIADKMVAPVIQYDLDGVAMDLEGGFNQPGAAELYKKVADRLAYQGKWFHFYYFGDIFKPNMFSAFGPLGVADISTYDVGQYRAPETDAHVLPSTLSYIWGGFTAPEAAKMYSNFKQDQSCTTITNDGFFNPVSYCSLSINDSYSENNRRYKDTYHQISTQDAVIYFNGKYQLTVPLADSATEWNASEVWNPDFTPDVFKKGRLMTTSSCVGVDNAFFVKNAQDLETNPESPSYKKLQACLLSDPANEVTPGMPMQTFSACGKGIPYAKCILVSSIPGSGKIGEPGVVRSNILDYIRNNIAVYSETNESHATGYSIFALENSNTAPAGAFGKSEAPNITVQEPWYIGYNFPGNPDPYYNQDEVNTIWQGFSDIIDSSGGDK